MKKDTILSVALSLLGLAIAFAAGFLTNHLLYPPELEFPVLSEARQIMDEYAWYPAPSHTEQEYGMIKGLVESYNDPYASFVEPVQHELTTNTFEGSFGGIGAQLTINQDGETVLYPFPEGPAARAGIVDADVVIAVDGTTIDAQTALETTVALVRGPVGDRVTLTVLRHSNETIYEFSIKREEFSIPSVTWRVLEENDQVGLIRVNLIAHTTPEEIIKAVDDLKTQGAAYFILDLRGNTGGLLEAGIDIARLFLSDGTVIVHQLANEKPEEYQVTKAGELADIPLAVLIDGYTASASEIIAGALQQHGRAWLVGTESYGKDTIQLIFNLSDASSIHVTTGKWWLPGEQDAEDFFLSPEIAIAPENMNDAECFRLAIETLLGE